MIFSWLLCIQILVTGVFSDVGGGNGQYILRDADRGVIRPKLIILSTVILFNSLAVEDILLIARLLVLTGGRCVV